MKVHIDINEEDMIKSIMSSYKFLIKNHTNKILRGPIESVCNYLPYRINLNDDKISFEGEEITYFSRLYRKSDLSSLLFKGYFNYFDIRTLLILISENNNKDLRTEFQIFNYSENLISKIKLYDIKFGKVNRGKLRNLIKEIYRILISYFSERGINNYYRLEEECFAAIYNIFCDSYDKWW